jgi:hypothetical protein
MARYAQYTQVPVDRSRAEIERTLERYGACGFLSGWLNGEEELAFQYKGIQYRVSIKLLEDQQKRRQMWRALLLVVKAKLEAVTSGISTIEEEFLAWIVTPTGTLGKRLLPQLKELAACRELPKLLPGVGT